MVSCGNGAIDAGEQCDDRNMTGGDGCSSTCQLEMNVVRENCGAAMGSLRVRSGQTIVVRGTTAGRNNDSDGGMRCQATGADIVLRVRAVDGGTLRVVATPQTAWDLVLRAGGNCPGSMCIDMGMLGVAETYTQNGVSGGTDIDVVVDGFMGASGGFDLSISLM
jgi:cysteine-rich repeat protein